MTFAIGGVALIISGATLAVVRGRYVSVLVEGSSMEPTLRSGQRVLVRRTRADRIRRGQVVVLAHPRAALRDSSTPREAGDPPWLIKRVAAVPGDPIPRDTVPALRHVTESRIPSGRLVLVGDNAAASYDSRRAGYFTTETVLGIVVRTLRF